MEPRRFPAVAIGLLLVVLVACRSPGTGGPPSLDGTWQLVSGTHDGVPIAVAGRAVTLIIDGDRASGQVCNSYGGTVKVSGSSVRFSAISMTEMGCPEPLASLESTYQAALAVVDRASRSGDSLVLSGPGAELRFGLAPPVAKADLVGTRWLLESLIDGDSVSSVLGHGELLLGADGSISGSTGCRGFRGRYATTAGGTLTVTGLTSDPVLCTRELTGQDQAVLTVISGGFTVKVDGRSLTLSGSGGQGLAYRAADDATATPSTAPLPSASIANPEPIEPSALPKGSPDLSMPPGASIDGVAGRPVSWCWANACADGALDAAPNPALADPHHFTLSDGSSVTSLEVTVLTDAASAGVSVAVDADGRIGSLPAGAWRYLVAFVRFAGGGDASYAWSLSR